MGQSPNIHSTRVNLAQPALACLANTLFWVYYIWGRHYELIIVNLSENHQHTNMMSRETLYHLEYASNLGWVDPESKKSWNCPRVLKYCLITIESRIKLGLCVARPYKNSYCVWVHQVELWWPENPI